jgi:hypothetical protein
MMKARQAKMAQRENQANKSSKPHDMPGDNHGRRNKPSARGEGQTHEKGDVRRDDHGS